MIISHFGFRRYRHIMLLSSVYTTNVLTRRLCIFTDISHMQTIYLFLCSLHVLCEVLSSTGALRELQEYHNVAIQEAIDQKCWDTAASLLYQALTGKS